MQYSLSSFLKFEALIEQTIERCQKVYKRFLLSVLIIRKGDLIASAHSLATLNQMSFSFVGGELWNSQQNYLKKCAHIVKIVILNAPIQNLDNEQCRGRFPNYLYFFNIIKCK